MTTAKQERGLRLLDKIDINDLDAVQQDLHYDIDFTVERRGNTPLHLAAKKGNLDILELLIGCGADVNIRNDNGFTPLHYAAREGHIGVVRGLLNCGADINTQNKEGDAPIHEIVKYQNIGVIEEMVAMGMKLNLSNTRGETALHNTCIYNRPEVTELLLVLGADASLRDKNGTVAMDLCNDKGLFESVRRFCMIRDILGISIMNVQGQTIATEHKTEPVYLNRVGVTLENASLLDGQNAPSDKIHTDSHDGTAHSTAEDRPETTSTSRNNTKVNVYCKREDYLYNRSVIQYETGDELLSDIFHIKTLDVTQTCHVTISVPIPEAIMGYEEAFVRYADNRVNLGECTTKKGEGFVFTFQESLLPETAYIFGVYTRIRTQTATVSSKGIMIKSPVLDLFHLDIKPGTFEENTRISIRIFPPVPHCTTDESSDPSNTSDTSNTSQCDDAFLTNLVQITSDTTDVKKPITLTLPSIGSCQSDKDLVHLLGPDDVFLNEKSLEASVMTPRIEGSVIHIQLPHCSMHVIASRPNWSKCQHILHDALSACYQRKQFCAFFVVVKYSELTKCPVIIVECCRADRCVARLQHWRNKDFMTQKPEVSGWFLTTPCEEFLVMFKNVIPRNADENNHLVFLPRRSTFQIFSAPKREKEKTAVKGTVIIAKVEKEHTNIIVVLPFDIDVSENKYRGTRKDFLLPDYMS